MRLKNNLPETTLTLLKGKTCVLVNSVQEFTEIEAWLLLIFFICLQKKVQSIKFYTFQYHILNSTDVKYSTGNSSNRQKMNDHSLPKFELVFILTQKNASSERFQSKVNRKSIVSSKKRC